MNAYEIESSIAEGREEFENLIHFVCQNADQMEAHQMEEAIFKKLQKIGLSSMKVYFAEKGTGDIGDQIQREDGVIMSKVSGLRSRTYKMLFGSLPIPRSYYHTPGEAGVFPLDEAANLPERCYSYYLQEWMNELNVDHPFEEGAVRLKRWFDLSLVESVMVDV